MHLKARRSDRRFPPPWYADRINLHDPPYLRFGFPPCIVGAKYIDSTIGDAVSLTVSSGLGSLANGCRRKRVFWLDRASPLPAAVAKFGNVSRRDRDLDQTWCGFAAAVRVGSD